MEWIKTSEKTPTDDGAKIVYYQNEVTLLVFNVYHECWDGADGDDYCCDIQDVEYWMDLPNLPK